MNQGQWIRIGKSRINVIFIHGINSSEECWKHQNGSYWPTLLKDEDELDDIGIYIFKYRTGINTGSYSLSDIVDSFREYFLLDSLIDSLGIIFVCHSMGGIVARRFLVKEQSLLLKKGLNKIGLFLVASPSLGSEYANMLSIISRAIGHTQASALQFSQNNVWLNDLDKDFMNLKSIEGLQIKGKELIEDLPLYGKGLIRTQIVKPFSGARYFGDSFKVPGSNHCTIAAPANKDEIQNRLLVKFVKDSLEEFRTLRTSRSELLTVSHPLSGEWFLHIEESVDSTPNGIMTFAVTGDKVNALLKLTRTADGNDTTRDFVYEGHYVAGQVILTFRQVGAEDQIVGNMTLQFKSNRMTLEGRSTFWHHDKGAMTTTNFMLKRYNNIEIRPISENLEFKRGKEWKTCSNYKFIFQNDGNLVLYGQNGSIWATGTNNQADLFVVQADGNTVLYGGGRVVWATNTDGNPGAFLAIQSDGNVVIYSRNGNVLWSTGTEGK